MVAQLKIRAREYLDKDKDEKLKLWYDGKLELNE
jgi:hypothetical protein